MPKKKLPPRAVEPDAKPAPEPLARPYQQAIERVPEQNRPRYRDAVRLVERLCDDAAKAAVAAAERSEALPDPDRELVATVVEYAVRGRL